MKTLPDPSLSSGAREFFVTSPLYRRLGLTPEGRRSIELVFENRVIWTMTPADARHPAEGLITAAQDAERLEKLEAEDAAECVRRGRKSIRL
jgi:hypothetical protein